MNLNNIVLSEISHAQKDKYWVVLLNTEYLEWANIGIESRLEFVRG